MTSQTLLNQRYELVSQHGSGGMSVIYRALDRSLGRIVAVKILRPNLTKDPSFIDKFQQEARSVARMAHPNIVTVHDVGSDGATHYIVMEMIEGRDLKKLIKTRGALELDRALDYAIQLCGGLGFAHRSRLVHADVKPQNILINKEGVLKITDFGIAQAFTDTLPQERSKVVWGSPHYFAPEQARGEKPSPASDVYSIGIVLFEMFTGRLPYIGSSQRELALAHIRDDVPRAGDLNADLPAELSKIIAKVMSKRPNDRYRTADQLGKVLQELRERVRAEALQRSGIIVAPAPQRKPRQIPAASEQVARPSQAASPSPAILPSPPATVTSQFPAAPPARRSMFKDDGSLNPEATGGYAGPLLPQRRQPENGIDVVTLLLVLLAILAVAGLAPLYLLGVVPLL